MTAKTKPNPTDRMQRALQTALPPEVASRLQQGGGAAKPETVMRVVPDDEGEAPKDPVVEPAEARVKPEPKPATKAATKTKPASTPPARRTRSAKADLGELDLGERIRQITTRMPISLADRLDIAVLRQKRTGGDLRSIQAIMLAGAERVVEELENDAA